MRVEEDEEVRIRKNSMTCMRKEEVKWDALGMEYERENDALR